jgi:nucleoside-diphosphate-sugar epimerase
MLDRLVRQVLDSVPVMYRDISDSWRMDTMNRCGDTVYPLAAVIGIPYCCTAPQSYVEANVSWTKNVLDAVSRHAIGRVVMAFASQVCGFAMYTPIDETHPLHPQSPYAASKVAADQLGLSCSEEFRRAAYPGAAIQHIRAPATKSRGDTSDLRQFRIHDPGRARE